MSSSLLDHLRSTFTPAAVSELSRTLGEAPAPIQKALDGLLPAVTAGVINRASGQQGATQLYQLLRDTPFARDSTLSQLVDTGDHRQKAADSGNGLFKQLYPDQPNRLAEATAQYSGVSPGSATTLTGLVMSVLMGFLHQQLSSRSLTQSQLSALLLGETDSARLAIPTGLAALLGWFLGTPRPASALRTEPIPPAANEDRPAGVVWWRWLLGALAARGAGFTGAAVFLTARV